MRSPVTNERETMKAVILAGGLGTRISEESHLKPKPMIEIGGKPILWHIMKQYSAHGIHDFVICLGYKGYAIKDFFANYFLHTSDVTFDMRNNRMDVHQNYSEPWSVTLIDTGEETMTGGRLLRAARYLKDEEAFCFTYGDGVFRHQHCSTRRLHKAHGRLATVTAVQPPGRYGALAAAAIRCWVSPRNRAATVAGSTAASSCCHPKSCPTSLAMKPVGRPSRWRVWPRMNS
jgi:glucose-1-phosphate cytidylyltransferase